jgi:hypothetical protein
VEQPHFDVELAEGLIPGRDYCFLAGLETPGLAPENTTNVFHILLTTYQAQVVDAKMNVPLPSIVSGLYVFNPTLSFSSSAKSAVCDLEFTIRVRTKLALNLTALQFALPDRFQVLIEPVVNLDDFPTPKLRWYRHFPTRNLVRVEVDGERPISAGYYRFRLAARLPFSSMPPINLFFVSFCADLFCTDVFGAFPIAGFRIGDKPTLGVVDQEVEKGYGARAVTLAGFFATLCFFTLEV